MDICDTKTMINIFRPTDVLRDVFRSTPPKVYFQLTPSCKIGIFPEVKRSVTDKIVWLCIILNYGVMMKYTASSYDNYLEIVITSTPAKVPFALIYLIKGYGLV